MSTNYYAVISTCPNRDHDELLHIGKSSNGWRFLFRSYPDRKLTSPGRWRTFLLGVPIVDEYGRDVDLNELYDKVKSKCRDKQHGDSLAPGIPIRRFVVADMTEGEFC